MIQLHFGVKQLKIGKSMGALNSFVLNYVEYANSLTWTVFSEAIM